LEWTVGNAAVGKFCFKLTNTLAALLIDKLEFFHLLS
jgi:hypothetical protein